MFSICILLAGNVLAQTDTLSVLQITDLHLIFNQEVYNPEMMEYRKQKGYDQGEPRLRQFLQTVPRETKSNMVIATGDLVDFLEGETRDGNLLNIQAEQFSKFLSDYQVPVLLTLGNHDAFTFNWRDNKLYPNQNFAGRARAAWIRNVPCFKDGTYYSKIYQVGKTTYRLIFLDDIFFRFKIEQEEEVENPYMEKSQLYWLKTQLAESDKDIEIILMHIPFDEGVDQGKISNELYSVLAARPTVKLILAGHHHKNSIERFTSEGNNKIVQVQTGAFAKGIENWRQIKFTENQISISLPGKTENELIIPVY